MLTCAALPAASRSIRHVPARHDLHGSNGCTAEIDADTGCSHYLVLVAPQEWELYHPGGAQASARIFDGNNDYVLLLYESRRQQGRHLPDASTTCGSVGSTSRQPRS